MTGARSNLLVPDGWSPRIGVRVAILASKDDPQPPHGVWRCLDRAPRGWWLQPVDERARAWAARWPNMLTQGCVAISGTRLVPPGKGPAG